MNIVLNRKLLEPLIEPRPFEAQPKPTTHPHMPEAARPYCIVNGVSREFRVTAGALDVQPFITDRIAPKNCCRHDISPQLFPAVYKDCVPGRRHVGGIREGQSNATNWTRQLRAPRTRRTPRARADGHAP